ncbi:hypothetical protein vBAspATola_05 [Aeromonas phage vB_AspA_Tola]|nr:hypothetical protein vBAspATola_05 [Aeromonas phage vB_AspA_Tola]
MKTLKQVWLERLEVRDAAKAAMTRAYDAKKPVGGLYAAYKVAEAAEFEAFLAHINE